MVHPTRRAVLVAATGLLAATRGASFGNAEEKKTLTRGTSANQGLSDIMSKRQSIRSYAPTPLETDKLAELLWTANGINRKATGGHTAPSYYASYASDLLVADAHGVWVYDPTLETLAQTATTDIRKLISPEPFVATAPVVILHLTNLKRMHKASREEQIRFAYVDAAIIGQNIYIYCAAVGLGTCLVGGLNPKALDKALGLTKDSFVTFAQPVGYPKPA